jgi:hypothetical protein
MKTNIQKTLQASLCLAILISLVSSTMSFGMEVFHKKQGKQDSSQKLNLRLRKLGSSEAIPYLYSKMVTERLGVNPYQGTPANNPLMWITQEANAEQLDIIERIYNQYNPNDFKFGASKTIHFDLSDEDKNDLRNTMPDHVIGYLINAFPGLRDSLK